MQIRPDFSILPVLASSSGGQGMDGQKMLTVKQAAEHLQVGVVTVQRWLRSGKIEGVRLGGTRAGWRIPESEVVRLLKAPTP